MAPLTLCPVCSSSTSFKHFPLCGNCSRSLLISPPLCPRCSSPQCLQSTEKICLRPWVRFSEIQSFHALYALTPPCYRVLRIWKLKKGPILDRKVLSSALLHSSQIKFIKEAKLQALIPMPQRFERSWRLRGSATHALANWLYQNTGIPVLHPLEIHKRHSISRQAQLSGFNRISNSLCYSVNFNVLDQTPNRILLIDDFMTSGHTLRNGARTLHLAGQGGVLRNLGSSSRFEIHCLCLGIRLPHLMHRPRGAERISEQGQTLHLAG